MSRHTIRSVLVAGLVLAALWIAGCDGESVPGPTPSGTTEERTPTRTATVAPTPVALEKSVFLEQCGDVTILHAGGWSTLDVPEQVGYVDDMIVDDEGQLCVIGSDTLGVFDGTRWVQYTTEGILLEAPLALDSHGQIWVGRLDGVSVLRGDQWVSYDFPGHYPANVTDIAVDERDRVWTVTNEGLRVLDGGTWMEHDLGLEEAVPVNAVAVDEDGRIWAGHWHGVSVFDGQRWATYGPLQEVDVPGLRRVQDLAVDAAGAIWAISSSGTAWVFRDDEWTRYGRSNSGLLGGKGLAISTDLSGRVWIGTDWHLTVFDGTKWVSYTPANSDMGRCEIEHVAVLGEGPAVLPEPTGPGVGTVTGAVWFSGEPLPGAEVHVCWYVEEWPPFFYGETPCVGQEYVATTGPNGRFSLEIPMGCYGWVIRSPEGKWIVRQQRAELEPIAHHEYFCLDSGGSRSLGKTDLGEE